MKTGFLIACVVCASIVVIYGSPQSKEHPAGWVRGTVSDEQGGLQGIPLVIEGSGATYEAITDSDGKYRASVPPGTYRIYPQFFPGDPAYLRFKRAKFIVLPGAYTTIDLSPFAGFDYCSRKGERLVDLRPSNSATSKPRKIPPTKYDTYLVRQVSGEPLDLVIDFCKREMKGGLIVYKSAAITFNDMTVYADRVSLRPKDLLLQTVGGKAMLIAGEESQSVAQFSTTIRERTFIDLTEGFTDSLQVKANLHDNKISFDLNIERGGTVKVVYEDREKDIKLVSEGESLSFVTVESPHTVRLSGYGRVTTGKLATLGLEGYSNFNITIKTNNNREFGRPSTISISIPNITGYNLSGIIPDGSVKIRREMMPTRLELANSIN
ncbi:MAG TPA: carboxypeptidase-like regulatory domain-containing protein [Pyrinomonadaceae bacterium]|nr:carboxypeptidase-like regulatory domain-containing protein [Pyrinomonadaceae bacterium]